MCRAPLIVCLGLLWTHTAAAQPTPAGLKTRPPAAARRPPAAGQNSAAAQDPARGPRNHKQAMAEKIAGDVIRVDGRLDEEAWLQATPLTDFVQKEPNEGATPTDEMEVRFLYDEDALYVGARMYARNHRRIQAPLGRRDNVGQAEHFLVSLDTFLDRRTAYTFGVSAAGVRLDHFHPTDNEHNVDAGFDPVWEARTSRDADGWTAELWIPFSQLDDVSVGEPHAAHE